MSSRDETLMNGNDDDIKYKFNIGDKVIFTARKMNYIAYGLDFSEGNYIDHIKHDGLTGKVTKIDSDGTYGVVFNGEENSFYIHECELELITKEVSVNNNEELRDEDKAYPDTEAGGQRFNNGKLPMGLIPPEATKAMARCLAYGANKYAARNWEKGLSFTECYESLQRHLLEWFEGIDNDDESGLSHLDHVITNAAFLVHLNKFKPQFDDRIKREEFEVDESKILLPNNQLSQL